MARPFPAQARDDRRLFRRLAWFGSGCAFSLIVLGAVVRITGSGMGCGDHWPRCDGEWFPPLDLPTLIEIAHRWVAALLSVIVLGLAWLAWRKHRSDRLLWRPAAAAAVLLVLQVLLGAITVKLELPPAIVIVHLANAMILLAALVVAALGASEAADLPAPSAATQRTRKPGDALIIFTLALGFTVILLGAVVANLNAGLVCQGFPLCNGRTLPPPTALGVLHWLHRALAFTFLLAVVAIVARIEGNAASKQRSELRGTARTLLFATLLQIGIGAAMVLSLLPPALRAAHLFAGTVVWASLVALVYRSHGALIEGRALLLADLVALTKPRIISLLLLTTLAPMFITDRGMPSLSLVFWVALGGYLMAGGANAINMWFDRDIDNKMSRTKLRPIPSGRVSPGAGLTFGITLAALAFVIFWYLVNPLSAWLALSGLLFYVFVYTIWLKRSSPQNIVIGGAAGAFPPLVGWAAVTGTIDLAAVYLFAIIFYWTPPHFWALALIKRSEYAKAGVPMMPVVCGERKTKLHMLIYTILLFPLTLMPSFSGALGIFYGVAAAILGARLLWYSFKLMREPSVTPTAWRMYRYSLVYLALLFLAMSVDRALPFGRNERMEVLILDRPEQPAPASGHHSGR